VRCAELRRHLFPCELHRLLDDDLGDFGQVVADPHQWNAPGQVGHRHAEDRGALELPQHFHLALRLLFFEIRKARSDFRLEHLARGRQTARAVVEQLIEQQRVRGNLRSQEFAYLCQVHQPASYRRVFVQQREVRRALAGRLEDPQHAAQDVGLRGRRILRDIRDERQQPRHQRIQPGAARRVQPSQRAAIAELEQQRGHLVGLAEATSTKRRGELRRVRAAHPCLDDAADAGHLGARRLVAREHDFLECARDPRAMQRELGHEDLPGLHPHRQRDA
jgi:hypothetical protein